MGLIAVMREGVAELAVQLVLTTRPTELENMATRKVGAEREGEGGVIVDECSFDGSGRVVRGRNQASVRHRHLTALGADGSLKQVT